MAQLLRILSWSTVIVAVLLIGLGLWNEHQGNVGGAGSFLKDVFSYSVEQSEQKEASKDGVHRLTRGHAQLLRAIGCDLPPDSGQDPGTAMVSYQWNDAHGVTHFSDRAPSGDEARESYLRTGAEEFFVTVTAENAVLPAGLEGYINAGAKRAYERWRDWIGDDAIVRSHINLRFVGDQDTFNKVYGRSAADGWITTGFYRIRSNEAYVLYSKRMQATALGTAFHEMSHLITAWHLGATPPWLNEGIAEYFETMEVQWQSARFNPNRDHIYRLRQNGAPSLEELTQLTSRDWMSRDAEQRYAAAWSLVAFLLETDQGQRTLSQVLRNAHAQRCEPGSDLAEPLERYPGGVVELERDWHRWILES